MQKLNLVGEVFGRLKVLKETEQRGTDVYWLCVCTCGTEKEVSTRYLRNGHTASCGCLHKDWMRSRNCKVKSELTEESNFLCLYKKYRREAIRRSLIFDLTQEEFRDITKRSCAYCGMLPSQVYIGTNKVHPYVYNGVDRKNNTEGYTVSNSVPCCKICNYAKKAMPLEVFLLWIKRLVAFQNREGDTTQA